MKPAALIGHSLGENTAACVAGVLSFEDALGLVVLRGTLFERVPEGGMITVPLSAAEIEPLLTSETDLATVNSPELCVVSGTTSALDDLTATLAEREIDAQRVRINIAAHSRLVEPILDDFRSYLQSISLHPPEIPFISNRSGTWITDEQATDPDYWVNHLRHTVNFADGVETLLKEPGRVFLEVGPGKTLSSLVKQQKSATPDLCVLSSLRHPKEEVSDTAFFVTVLGRLWAAGVPLERTRLWENEQRQRVSLPTYSFQHEKYWIEPTELSQVHADVNLVIEKKENIDDWFYRPVWQKRSTAGRQDLTADAFDEQHSWLIFLDSGGVGSAIAKRLRDLGHQVSTVREGDSFYSFGDGQYAITPEEGRDSYSQLMQHLIAEERVPDRIVHLWMLTHDESFRPGSSFFHRNQERGIYSLIFLTQAWGELASDNELILSVVSNGMQAVNDEVLKYPDKATVLGPVKVIPREFVGIRCQSIDVDLLIADEQHPPDPAAAIQELATQLMHHFVDASGDQITALRNGQWWTQEYEPFQIAETESESRLRQKGVYLVTGGLGGIGLTIAEHLASSFQARLVLVGRSDFPPAEQWDAWQANHSERDPTSRKISRMRKMQEQGAEVIVASGDVANVQEMRHAMELGAGKFGTINGIIHAAGTIADGVIQTKTTESIDHVFTPKVHGTVVLSDLAEDFDLDFFVVFSSTSSLLGPAGQVDYTGVNAFLNAFAQHRSADFKTCPTIAINWGVWQDVGMGASISRQLSGTRYAEGNYVHKRVPHPLLDERLVNGSEKTIYATTLSAQNQWILNEHRTKAGRAVVPGTAYIEIARGAWEGIRDATNCEIRDLSFVAPLSVDDDEELDIRVSLTPDRDGYQFEVQSCSATGTAADDQWQLHAQGRVASADATSPTRLSIDEIAARCSHDVATRTDELLTTRQADLLRFGPRWDTYKEIRYGQNEALAFLELSDEFVDDLEHYKLHPAVLDMATGFGLPLVPGYDDSSSLYVPLTYGRVNVHHPLPKRVVSYLRGSNRNTADQEVATFDIVIADGNGEVLVEIEEFTVRRMGNTAFASNGQRGAASPQRQLTSGEQLFLDTYKAGIRPSEGVRVLDRILSGESPPQIVVSPVDLEVLLKKNDLSRDDTSESTVKFTRPNISSTYEAPTGQARIDAHRNMARPLGR